MTTAPPLSAADGRVHARYWLETGDDPQRAAVAVVSAAFIAFIEGAMP
jgi:hypothetical protein